MRYDVREMRLEEARLMIRYFLEADLDFLNGMGVEPSRLPAESEWFELLADDFDSPLEQKQFYYLVWELDDEPIGHCNINKIEFGQHAYMHLHIWQRDHRRSGCAASLLPASIVRFFEHFQLQQLFCEPYALNPAPNRTLPKMGFQLEKSYETIPGWICFEQTVNRWVLDRKTALSSFESSAE